MVVVGVVLSNLARCLGWFLLYCTLPLEMAGGKVAGLGRGEVTTERALCCGAFLKSERASDRERGAGSELGLTTPIPTR
jgi:hypothetical protein